MSNRAATTLAVAVVIWSLCLCGSPAQVPDRPRAATERAIVADHAHAPGERPGRYQLAATSSSAGSATVIDLDMHTGHCWSKSSGQSWHDAGSPVKQK